MSADWLDSLPLRFAGRLRPSLFLEYRGTACYECDGSKNKDGYARVWHDGRWFYAHRLAWTILRGEIPEGHVVRHACNNRTCCNPEHLLTGTILENVRDQIEGGTFRRRGSRRRFTATQAAVIKFLLPMQGVYPIAIRLGVADQTIRDIRDGKTWAKVKPQMPAKLPFDPFEEKDFATVGRPQEERRP